MLFKVVVFLVLGGLLYLFFTGRIGLFSKNKNKKLDSTDMIECETCGAFVIEKDALVSYGNHHYCSQACRNAKS